MTDRDIARLGQFALERRLGLGLSQAKVAEAGGPSDTTLGQLESGTLTAVRPATLAKLDTGLRWVSGSAAATLQGGSPTPVEDIDKSAPRPKKGSRRGRRPEEQDWVDPFGGMHVALSKDQLTPERINQLLVVIADLDVQTRGLLESEDPATRRAAASAQRTVSVVSQAIAEWMGGEDQLIELAEALSRLARQSKAIASDSASPDDSTVIDRLTESGR